MFDNQVFLYVGAVLTWWSSQPWFKPLLDLFTVIMLFLTAWVSYVNLRVTSKANELQLLPILAIFFRGKELGNKKVFIRNIGKSPAFDVKIDAYNHVYLDTQMCDKITFTVPGTNVLVPNEEIELEVEATRNGEYAEIKEFMTYLLDPSEKYQGKKTVKLVTVFRNAEGNYYYSRFVTGIEGLSIEPAKRLNLVGKIYLWLANLDQKAFFFRVNLVWRHKKPYRSNTDSTKNWFLKSVKEIFWKSLHRE